MRASSVDTGIIACVALETYALAEANRAIDKFASLGENC